MELPFYGFDGTSHYEFKWYFGATQPKRNINGTFGRATIISRDCWTVPDLATIRVHVCASDPCYAVFPDSKYPQGPPMHVQPTTWRPPASVAGAPGPSAAVAAPAGAAAAAVDAVAVDAAAAAVDADAPHLSEAPDDAAVAAASRPSVPPPKCEPLPPPPAPPPEKPAWEPLPPPPLPPPPLAKPPPECPAPPVPAPPPSGAPLRRMCAAEPVVATPGAQSNLPQ